MTRRTSVLILAAAVFLASSPLHGQRYNFKFYGEEEGLQNLAVQVVLQDRAGFLWVGTQNGLFRYDGSRFVGFGKSDGLPGARIESLHESIDGVLWVGTRNGLARRNRDRFEVLPLGVAQGIVGRAGIASDSSGRLYLATEHGLAMGVRSGEGMQFTLASPSAPAGRPEAHSVHVDAKGIVWFGLADSLYRLENGRVREVGSEERLPPARWEAIAGDLDGNLWVRSDHALYERGSGGKFELQSGLPESSNTYPTLALDPSGRLLVPTNRGLARQSGHGWEMIGAQAGLATNDISAVMQDREGSIWLGLLGSGLARWLGYNEWESWSDREGLSRESIWSIARDAAGTLWVGTQFGLNYAQRHDGKLEWKRQPVSGIDFIRTLAAAPDGTLWIGGDPGGLHQLNPRTGQARAFGEAQGLPSRYIRHVMVDAHGSVWASTRNGLFRCAAGSSRFEQVFPAETDSAEFFHQTMMDRQGQVWAAGDRGLARLSGSQWKRYTKKDGLKFDGIAQVAEDPDGSLWIGYRDAYGISRVSFPGGELKLDHYNLSNGLRSDKSIFLGFDARGWLWSGTDHGVDVFDRVRWRHYGRSDGLIWDDCNSNGFMAEADGSVWTGTSRGLSRYRPSSTPAPNVPPPVVFTSVKFGDQSVDQAARTEVPYPQNALQVRFAALTFVQEASVLFRYRLANIDRDWRETAQRELNFLKLPPGQYTLEVMARNSQGLWSLEPARLSFQILTPWWLAWWFRLASVLLGAAIVRLLWQKRTRRLEVERNRLETAVTERTRELSLEKQRVLEEKARAEQQKLEIERLLTEAQQASKFKSEFLANVSHEFRTPVNGILGMTDLVLATPLTPEQRDYLDTARLSASGLLTILNDVLDFSKIEAGRLDLNPVEFSLRQCVRDTAKMCAIPAAGKNLAFEVDVADSVPARLVGDPDRLRQVLLNLIGNAIKFTTEGGVRLTVDRDPSSEDLVLRFIVRDTGIGIAAEKQTLIFEAFRQADGSTTRKYGGTGLGLTICSRLVELLGGSIRVESQVGRGSEFQFTARFAPVLTPISTNDRPTDSLSLVNALEAAGASVPPEQPLRILLAEDNVVNQRLAMRLLQKRGHRVALATTGREALDHAARERFDLILMDLQMPDMDGLEATAIIRRGEQRSGAHTPIVALTAHTMKGDRERCLEAGMDDYINKPIDARDFIEMVETAAGRSISPSQPCEPASGA